MSKKWASFKATFGAETKLESALLLFMLCVVFLFLVFLFYSIFNWSSLKNWLGVSKNSDALIALVPSTVIVLTICITAPFVLFRHIVKHREKKEARQAVEAETMLANAALDVGAQFGVSQTMSKNIDAEDAVDTLDEAGERRALRDLWERKFERAVAALERIANARKTVAAEVRERIAHIWEEARERIAQKQEKAVEAGMGKLREETKEWSAGDYASEVAAVDGGGVGVGENTGSRAHT